MNEELKNVIHQAHRWLEQEQVWDDALYATVSKTAKPLGSPRLTSGGDPGVELSAKRQGFVVPARRSSEPPKPFATRIHSTARPSSPPTSLARRSSPEEIAQKTEALQALYEKYKNCTRCSLGSSRLKFVFGVGNPDAEVLFIGEGPGFEEDHRGEPFIGRAGQLLDKMMEAIGLSRKAVYIANVVKCHAMINPQTPDAHGNDRPPTPLEVETCSPILQQQIAVIRPKIIVTLGSPATRAMLGSMEGISKLRGRFFPMPLTYFRHQSSETDLFDSKSADEFTGLTPDQLVSLEAIQVLPIYHPAALLRNPNLKKDSWEDMKLLRDTLLQKTVKPPN